jgi:hypothetical protein
MITGYASVADASSSAAIFNVGAQPVSPSHPKKANPKLEKARKKKRLGRRKRKKKRGSEAER